MYTSTFTFAKGEYDAEFHELDQAIVTCPLPAVPAEWK